LIAEEAKRFDRQMNPAITSQHLNHRDMIFKNASSGGELSPAPILMFI